ncbi:MAG: hypothetical protein L0Z62_44860 [Gemmataceae bacterium]|nr:hypothetical protein [Gemmataceae bacterium]
MSYAVRIPLEIRQVINSWDLPRWLRLEVYNALYQDLPARWDGLPRVPAPNPTVTFTFERPDPDNAVLVHWFTFYVTHDEQPDTLAVREAFYEPEEDFGKAEDGEE